MILTPEALDAARMAEATARYEESHLKARSLFGHYRYLCITNWQPAPEVPADEQWLRDMLAAGVLKDWAQDASWYHDMLAYIRANPMPRAPLSEERAWAIITMLEMVGNRETQARILKEEFNR